MIELFPRYKFPPDLLTKGFAFFYPQQDVFYTDVELHRYLEQSSSFEDFADRCSHLDGQWRAIVHPLHNPSLTYIAVDATASMRIFYSSLPSEKVEVSDSGFSLVLSPFTPTPEASLFFSRWGVLPDNATLHPLIFKMPPGSCMSIDERGRILTRNYLPLFSPPSNPLPKKRIELEERLREILERGFDRLIEKLDGRLALLPLTGGRDSRLIACALKQRNYPHVLTFSYGKNANIPDAVRAAKVAKTLGFKHRFIPSIPPEYGPDGYLQDPEALKFLSFVSGGASGYFFQEYLPAKQLSEEFGALNPVVLPGHVVDELFGGDFIEPRTQYLGSNRGLATLLMRLHNGERIVDYKERPELIRMIVKQMKGYDSSFPGLTPIQKYQLFLYYNLEINYFLNSANSWRYFGLDVWMPYALRELREMAFSLPAEHLYCKNLYEQVAKQYFISCGVSYDDDFSKYRLQQSCIARWKNVFRPWVAPFLEHKNRMSQDDHIGLEPIMRTIREQVKQEGQYYPTTLNGLSFAWLLQQLSYSTFF